jgi:hypothetical protein
MNADWEPVASLGSGDGSKLGFEPKMDPPSPERYGGHGANPENFIRMQLIVSSRVLSWNESHVPSPRRSPFNACPQAEPRYLLRMSTIEIMAELPKLNRQERRQVAKRLFELEDETQVLADCDRRADGNFLVLDAMEADDGRHDRR